MFQIRIHGRGGQGVVTAAELLSVAAFADGRDAQAFPSFGSDAPAHRSWRSAASTTADPAARAGAEPGRADHRRRDATA